MLRIKSSADATYIAISECDLHYLYVDVCFLFKMEVEQTGDHNGLQQYYITKIEEMQVSYLSLYCLYFLCLFVNLEFQ